MTNIVVIVIIAGVIGLQTIAGYFGNKYLGFILPILVIRIVFSLFLKGTLTFSLRDILIPLVGILSLAMIYERANKARQLKRKG
ncbi:hypothetical protein AB1395_00445 [Streptococcus pluranimalium]|uniref:hypothetical protein n=1 Tax=Streptococcus pluranimalium TaxID=82348 RepID=UPI0034655624